MKLAYPSSKIQKNDFIDKLYPYRKVYTDLGNILVSNMNSKKNQMLNKPKNRPPIEEESLQKKSEHQKQSAIENSLTR
ncbi:MAG: hypothetical protein IJH39_06610 [Clostridia bacterium]|nr:hypothetical protein [Clostridia bacterium]